MTDYLPKMATIEQACNWLQAKTGETWILARLLECALKPYFWLDYSPDAPVQIFGDKKEGYLASMIFAGDVHRLETDGTDALVTMSRTHDGTLFKTDPGMRVPLSDLRFKRDRIERVAEIINASKQAQPQAAPEPAPVVESPNADGTASIFRDMSSLNASELSLAFVGDKPESGLGANNMLSVVARGEIRRIPLASLGLVDKRNGHPNGECGVLLGLTQGLRPKKSDSNTQKMKRLRLVFLHHFGIEKDPFEPYMAATGWVPLFKVVDRRGAADERAKKEAEERMVSLEQLAEKGVQLRDRSNDDADIWMKENGHSY